MLATDIDELLKSADETLLFLENEKQDAISNKEKIKLSSSKIKSLLEHLRSSFDYMANDIYQSLRAKYSEDNKEVKEVKTLYFPIRTIPTKFKEVIQNDYRFIDEYYPEIFRLIESIQPFEKNDNWLFRLSKLANKNKHNGFSQQNRAEFTNVTVGASGGGIILIPPIDMDVQIGSVILQGKEALSKPIRFEKGKVVNPDMLPLDSKVDEITEFRWKGDYFDLLSELNFFCENTKRFKENFYQLITAKATD